MGPDAVELERGVEIFLSRLVETLDDEAAAGATVDPPPFDARRHEATSKSVRLHDQTLRELGFSLEQIIGHYGDVYRAVTELALDPHATVTTAEFQTLDRCLDSAIAGALTSWSVEDDKRVALRRPEPATDGARASRPVLYLVDRDPHVRRLVQRFVGDSHVIELFNDGLSALDRARKTPPAALIAEILIPELDGLGLCRALKSDPLTEHVPVLVASTLAAEGPARHSGADAFLGKPLEKKMFLASLRGLTAKGPRGDGARPLARAAS